MPKEFFRIQILGAVDVLRDHAPVVWIPRQVSELGVIPDGYDGSEHVIAHPRSLHEPIHEEARFGSLSSVVLNRTGEGGAERIATAAQQVPEEVGGGQRTCSVRRATEEFSSLHDLSRDSRNSRDFEKLSHGL